MIVLITFSGYSQVEEITLISGVLSHKLENYLNENNL